VSFGGRHGALFFFRSVRTRPALPTLRPAPCTVTSGPRQLLSEHANTWTWQGSARLDGHRFQVCITDLTDPDIAYLEALHRGRGRAERRICDAKDTGLTNLPSASFAINHAWLQLGLIASDLLAWPGSSPSTATSPAPNPNGSATACSTPPACSSAPDAGPGYASLTTGPGQTSSPPGSTGSTTWRCGSDPPARGPPAAATMHYQPDNHSMPQPWPPAPLGQHDHRPAAHTRHARLNDHDPDRYRTGCRACVR